MSFTADTPDSPTTKNVVCLNLSHYIYPKDWITTRTQTPHGGRPRVLVQRLNAKSSVWLNVDLIIFVLSYRNLQTWLEARLGQLAATGFWSLLTLILQQEVYFLGSGEGSGLTTGFSQTFSRALLPSTAHFLMTHAHREYTCVCVGRRAHSVHKPTTVSCCGGALRFVLGVRLESCGTQQHECWPIFSVKKKNNYYNNNFNVQFQRCL